MLNQYQYDKMACLYFINMTKWHVCDLINKKDAHSASIIIGWGDWDRTSEW